MARFTLLLLSLIHAAVAFAPSTFGVRHNYVLYAGQRDGDSGGGAPLAKPAVKIAQKAEVKNKEKSLDFKAKDRMSQRPY